MGHRLCCRPKGRRSVFEKRGRSCEINPSIRSVSVSSILTATRTISLLSSFGKKEVQMDNNVKHAAKAPALLILGRDGHREKCIWGAEGKKSPYDQKIIRSRPQKSSTRLGPPLVH